MGEPPRVFQNRNAYWEQRRALTASRKDESKESEIEGATGDNAKRELSNDHLNAAFAGISECPHCDNAEPELFKRISVDDSTEQHLVLTECLSCLRLIGADDTMSAESVKSWIESIAVKLCPCGNTDPQKYKLRQSGDKLCFQCGQCQKDLPLNTQEELPEDTCEFSCACGNDHGAAFSMYMENGKPQAVQCLVCDEFCFMQSENDYEDTTEEDTHGHTSDIEEAKKAKIVGRRAVKHARDLRKGDHIAWWRPEQYWHHALVKEIHASENAITVIHYNGPIAKNVKGKVIVEKLLLEKEAGVLYKLKYGGPCLTPDMAIARAFERMHETAYNFFLNNCEHFVRWCKTGEAICEQVVSAMEYGKYHFQKLQGLMKQMATDATKGQFGGMVAMGAGKEVVKGSGLGLNITDFAVIGLHMKKTLADIQAAHQQRAAGHIDREEFMNVVVTSTSQCVLSGTGRIIGKAIGTYFIPIPYAGGFVGATLGDIIGKYLGTVAGYCYTKYQSK